ESRPGPSRKVQHQEQGKTVAIRADRGGPMRTSRLKLVVALAAVIALAGRSPARAKGPAAPQAASVAAPAAPGPIVVPTGVERGASVEGISESRLANGLRVLLFPDPS